MPRTPSPDRPQRLARREALMVRELARFPGRPVAWYVLAEAMGIDYFSNEGKDHLARNLVGSYVQRVRQKFGSDTILAVPGAGGFYLRKDALDR